MKTRSYLIALALVTPLFVGCSSQKKQEQQAKEKSQEAAKQAEAEKAAGAEAEKNKNALLGDAMDYTTIEFDNEEISLSEMDKKRLNQLMAEMKGGGKVVEDLKVLTWSDRAVSNDQDATNTEIILARQRAESINKFLKAKVKPKKPTDFYNMAENPARYEAYMKEKGADIMEAFKEEGGAKSHAMVIIEYKSGPMPSSIQ